VLVFDAFAMGVIWGITAKLSNFMFTICSNVV
jgi:hypothetical protein